MKPEDVQNNHVFQPWDERTERNAPIAQDCPELEAFLSAVYRDLFNPSLRKKIKYNLTEEQHDFIKEVKTEYPKNNLRIRKEDKGHRFVIADWDVEDTLIEETVTNPEIYKEQEENPMDDYNAKIE